MALHLPAAARHRRPDRAPDGLPFCPDCLETGWRWRWTPRRPIWVAPCHCGRVVGPPPGGWSTTPEPPLPQLLVDSLDPRPPESTPATPHPIGVRWPSRYDAAGTQSLHGHEPYYPVCGCGWVGRPQHSERRGWDLAWWHARSDWRSVPVQPEPRALHRPRRPRGQPPPELPAGYRGPIPCHFGLADKHDGCGKGYLLGQRDSVTSYHGCRGVIPPPPWRAASLDRHGDIAEASAAARGEVCVCPCHLVPDEHALPRRCWGCAALMRVDWPVYRLCPSCEARVEPQRRDGRRPSAASG